MCWHNLHTWLMSGVSIPYKGFYFLLLSIDTWNCERNRIQGLWGFWWGRERGRCFWEPGIPNDIPSWYFGDLRVKSFLVVRGLEKWKWKVFLKHENDEQSQEVRSFGLLGWFTHSNRVRVWVGGVGIVHSISKLSFSLIPIPWQTKGILEMWTVPLSTTWRASKVPLLACISLEVRQRHYPPLPVAPHFHQMLKVKIYALLYSEKVIKMGGVLKHFK